MAGKTLADAVSRYGASTKSKLADVAISGAPEDQLRGPLEALVHDLAALEGLPSGSVHLIGETTLSDIKTRPDFAVTVSKALVGFIEVKAPGKGADPRRFDNEHDKEQWDKLKSLPNLIYTDGNAFSLWRDGKLEGSIVRLEGDVESAGVKLAAPSSLLALINDFLRWTPIPPKTAKQLAEVSARLCRLLRDEVIEQMARESPGLTGLADDWRKLLFPQADDAQFADGYAQAVTFGLLVARARGISLAKGTEAAAQELRKSNSLIGTALRLLTEDSSNQDALKTSLGTLARVLNEVNWHAISKDKPEAWLYFYEDFLEVYDNTLRKRTGSYYTPPEVVSAMVNLVDEALRGPLFERPTGFAAPDVVVADPAAGTGTFLLGVLRRIAATIRDDQGEGAVRGAIEASAKRIIGFEMQFGPFAVAQLRLIAEFQSLINSSVLPDLRLYITDTLGNPFIEEEWLPQVYEPVAKSRRDANEVKKTQPITVVIGNPPYKEKAEGRAAGLRKAQVGTSLHHSIAGGRRRNGASARTASILRIFTFISGAGRPGKYLARGIMRRLEIRTRTRKVLSVSSPSPAFSMAPVSRRCGTICGAPVPKSGSSIVPQKGIGQKWRHAFFKPSSSRSASCLPRASSARAIRSQRGFGFARCRKGGAKRNLQHSRSCHSRPLIGPIVLKAGAIRFCRPQAGRGRCFPRSRTSLYMTARGLCPDAPGSSLQMPNR